MDPFLVKNCFLAAIATGERAGSLAELRDKVATTHLGCIYFHFWGARLAAHLAHREYRNDFAAWANDHLHDVILAERLGAIDPTDFDTLDELKTALIEVLENRLDELEITPWTKKEDRFCFVRSKIIIFDTPYQIQDPKEMPKVISDMPPGAIFYHFIDARNRTEKGTDDFSTWLGFFGEKYQPLIDKLLSIDPYFVTLPELRHEVYQAAKNYFEVEK